MNMNKKILYFLILFFAFFGFSCNVIAAGAVHTCKYSHNMHIFNLKFIENDGAVQLKISHSYNSEAENGGGQTRYTYVYEYLDEFNARHYYSSGAKQFMCPNALNIKFKALEGNKNKELIQIAFEKRDASWISMYEENGYGGIPYGQQVKKVNRTCLYNNVEGATDDIKIYITPTNSGKMVYEISRSDYSVVGINGLTKTDFDNGCPSGVTIKCNNKKCNISKSSSNSSQQSEDSNSGSTTGGTGTEVTSPVDDFESIDPVETIDITKKTCSEGYRLQNGECVEDKIVGDNFCSEESVQKVLKLVGVILIIAKILIPLVLIILGSIDLFHAVVGKDEKDLIKSLKTLALRVGLGVFVFFVPSIVNWIFNLYYDSVGETSNNQCISCVLDINQCSTTTSASPSENDES